jgi:hypothetical protein
LITVVLADDNFDGKIDGCVLENGDADGDGRLTTARSCST